MLNFISANGPHPLSAMGLVTDFLTNHFGSEWHFTLNNSNWFVSKDTLIMQEKRRTHCLNFQRKWNTSNLSEWFLLTLQCVSKKNATHGNKVKPKNTQKLPTHHFMKNGSPVYSIFDIKSHFAFPDHFWPILSQAILRN